MSKTKDNSDNDKKPKESSEEISIIEYSILYANKNNFRIILYTLLTVWLALNAFLITIITQTAVTLSSSYFFDILAFAAVFGVIFNFTLNASAASAMYFYDEASIAVKEFKDKLHPKKERLPKHTARGFYQKVYQSVFIEGVWTREVYAAIGVFSLVVWIFLPAFVWFWLHREVSSILLFLGFMAFLGPVFWRCFRTSCSKRGWAIAVLVLGLVATVDILFYFIH